MTKTPETAYFDYQLEVMPSCYSGPNADRYFGTICPFLNHLGLEGDTLAIRARAFRNPSGLPSVLKLIGTERKMGKVPSETAQQYRARLGDAWTAWLFAGTPHAIVSQLALLGYTAEVVENDDWDWDGNTGAWARFWVVLTGHPFTHEAGIEYDDGSLYDDGHPWDGLGANTTHLADIRQIIRQWKPAHTWCSHIIVVTDPGTWAVEQPDGTWGDPTQRSGAAVYWNG
jgi:hypothetical protein